MRVKDIEGTILEVGDAVYYARKHNYRAKGELVECVITKIQDNGFVRMDKFTSTDPSNQLVKKKF
tara:strand:+ start:590 stop:784 length:195 start_codon:yes stop_codon:yes gene_type:complete